MKLHTKLVFKRNGICDSLEEIRKASHDSGVVKMDEVKLYVWPTEDLKVEIKPYEDVKDLEPIKDWKGPIHEISIELPLKDKVNKKLDKLYGPDELFLLANEPALYFGMWWWPTSEKLESWDYYGFSFSGRSLCDKKGHQLNKALNNPATYESDMCSKCSKELKNYCKDITSILNKYSLPKKIKITSHQEK